MTKLNTQKYIIVKWLETLSGDGIAAVLFEALPTCKHVSTCTCTYVTESGNLCDGGTATFLEDWVRVKIFEIYQD